MKVYDIHFRSDRSWFTVKSVAVEDNQTVNAAGDKAKAATLAGDFLNLDGTPGKVTAVPRRELSA